MALAEAPLAAPEACATEATRRRRLLLLLSIAAASALAGASLGSYRVSLHDAAVAPLSWLGLPVALDDQGAAQVLLSVRWPRVALGGLVGSSLGVAGAILQGVFRNPLADPGLCGVSSGAALGAAAALVLGHRVAWLIPAWLAPHATAAAAFVGGLGAVLAAARLATSEGRTPTVSLLLGGVAISALGGAATGWLTFAANDAQLRSLTFWSLGSLGGATGGAVAASLPLFALPLLLGARLSTSLDALLLGEAEAMHLGVDVEKTKRLGLSAGALAVGTSVALCGAVGFIGLVAPHLARMLVGALHRHVLPASALVGAALVVLADLLARCAAAPAELPLGVVTATLGAPVFLWLLRGALRGVP